MPSVTEVVAARQRPKPGEPPAERCCARCGDDIEVGQRIYKWGFRYGGPRYQHVGCGPVRPSQLTQSKLSAVYAAQESAEDQLDLIDSAHFETSPGDLEGVLEPIVSEVAEAVREVEQEYRDAAEAMGDAGAENEERADELDGWADDLESFSLDADEPDRDDTQFDPHAHDPDEDFNPADAWAEAIGDFVDAGVEQVRDLIGGCPL